MYLTRLIGILFKPHKKGQVSRWSTLATSPMLILLAIVSLTATMGQRYYNQPELKQGTIAPETCLLYTSPSPRDGLLSRMPSSA